MWFFILIVLICSLLWNWIKKTSFKIELGGKKGQFSSTTALHQLPQQEAELVTDSNRKGHTLHSSRNMISPCPATKLPNGNCYNSAIQEPWPPWTLLSFHGSSQSTLPNFLLFLSIKWHSSSLFDGLVCRFCYCMLILNCNSLPFPIKPTLLVK